MENAYLRRRVRESMEDKYLRRGVRERLKELGEKDLSWPNRLNTGGINTGCFCHYCDHEISLRFYEEDNKLGISIACSIDCTPTVMLDDIQKFSNMLKWAKVAFDLKREWEKDEKGKEKI